MHFAFDRFHLQNGPATSKTNLLFVTIDWCDVNDVTNAPVAVVGEEELSAFFKSLKWKSTRSAVDGTLDLSLAADRTEQRRGGNINLVWRFSNNASWSRDTGI